MPGKIARHLTGRETGLDEPELRALREGREVCRGAGFSVHVTATPQIHQALPVAVETLGLSASTADRKALRIYRDRLGDLAALSVDVDLSVRGVGPV